MVDKSDKRLRLLNGACEEHYELAALTLGLFDCWIGRGWDVGYDHNTRLSADYIFSTKVGMLPTKHQRDEMWAFVRSVVANARAMNVRYVICDGMIWKARTGRWEVYRSGSNNVSAQHKDHAHVTFWSKGGDISVFKRIEGVKVSGDVVTNLSEKDAVRIAKIVEQNTIGATYGSMGRLDEIIKSAKNAAESARAEVVGLRKELADLHQLVVILMERLDNSGVTN